MGEFIENNSTIGDVIVMAVRGGTRIHRTPYDSPIKTILRNIGVDDKCLFYDITGFTFFLIPILSI